VPEFPPWIAHCFPVKVMAPRPCGRARSRVLAWSAMTGSQARMCAAIAVCGEDDPGRQPRDCPHCAALRAAGFGPLAACNGHPDGGVRFPR